MVGRMQALAKLQAKRGMWWTDCPVPQCQPDGLVIKVLKTAICGTDLHIYNWDSWAQKTIPIPLVCGHEFVGEVVSVGDLVTGFAPGDRVSGEGHITCGTCRNCRAGIRHLCRKTVGVGVQRDGCFAEYLALPAFNAFKVDPDIPDTIAAIFDPFGNAVHTALAYDLVGEDVLITGAGPIGMMACAIARQVGARQVVITDVNDYRLELAASLGATRTVNILREDLPAVMSQCGMVEGFDVGLEMSGNQRALKLMLRHMNHGGKVALLGLYPEEVGLDFDDIVLKGLTLRGIYGREMFDTWYKMVALLKSGLALHKVVTHEFAAEDYQEAFSVMLAGQSAKVILHWDH